MDEQELLEHRASHFASAAGFGVAAIIAGLIAAWFFNQYTRTTFAWKEGVHTQAYVRNRYTNEGRKGLFSPTFYNVMLEYKTADGEGIALDLSVPREDYKVFVGGQFIVLRHHPQYKRVVALSRDTANIPFSRSMLALTIFGLLAAISAFSYKKVTLIDRLLLQAPSSTS
jgi:hypothetical protein